MAELKSPEAIRREIHYCEEQLMLMEGKDLTPLGIENRTCLTARKNALLWCFE
jgi:hypothetical protein